ncbi:MAG: KEOPS complex subunit Pcc1 [Candidatus Caldarchaeum sp.]
MQGVELEMKIYVDEDAANIMVRSVQPELSSTRTRRSSVELFSSGGCINVVLKSRDIVAARAASNTVVRLLKASYETLEAMSGVR